MEPDHMCRSRKALLINLMLSVLTISTMIMASSPVSFATEDHSSFSILAAREKGFFNIGPAIGDVSSVFDESRKKDVLKFDYTIFKGAIIGVWTKSFPPELESARPDAVRASVRVPDPEQPRQLSIKLEIKGTSGVQTVPLTIKNGWTSMSEEVEWGRVGSLREVVFVVSPTVTGKELEGVLYFDLDFYRLAPLQKYFIIVKFGLVSATAFLAALALSLIGRLFGRRRRAARHGKETSDEIRNPGLKRDLLYGISAVATGGIALSIYSLANGSSPFERGISFDFLIIGLAGALLSQILKYGLTGKHLTVPEVFLNILAAGLLAASSSRQAALQAPSSWTQVMSFSGIVSAITFIIYQILNARSLASSGKHLRVVTATFVLATPYLLNWLLLVGTVPGIIGKFFVVFIFNEAVVNGIGLLTKDRALKTARAHLFIFLVSLGVVISPLVANMGSGAAVMGLPAAVRAIVSILTSMLSFAGLWAEVYLITGTLLDGGRRIAPSEASVSKHVNSGMKKGMAYSGILMAILYTIHMLLKASALQKAASAFPMVIGIVSGGLIFPFLKTIIESFDGSQPFFARMRYSYRDATLYLRGAVAGSGFAYMITHNLFQQQMSDRIVFGLILGLAASGGVSILRDAIYALRGQGRIQSWRLYLTDSLLGAFVGGAAAFYLDSRQVPVVIEKFNLYVSSGLSPMEYVTYPLVNKWGRIDLGSYSGGVKLLFTESLAGVINWSIAAWLFAINKVFMQAFFEKDRSPIRFFFSKAGFAQLIEHMLYVLRWGLWMSPIIFTFLRMMPDPTWYNQDGAIRTLFATYHNLTTTPEAFRAWSLQIFIYVMAFDIFRVLIWMDHMGLRVATLVNLSFIGLDRLDERVARFIGPAAAQRYIPEAVKRFTTWAPLLIPFYIPRGQEWDYAWSTAEAMQNAARGKGILPFIQSLSMPEKLVLTCAAVAVCAGVSFGIRSLSRRSRRRREKVYELDNREYRVVLKDNGEVYSEVIHKECDISRRAYDSMNPCGRILYIVDPSGGDNGELSSWPIIGNFPSDRFKSSRIGKRDDVLNVVNSSCGIKTTVKIALPDRDSAAELWEVRLENLTDKARGLKVVPYLEWVLNGGIHDRFHTQYARLYPQMEYVSASNAILSWHNSTKSMGVLASDVPPEGFLTSRVDFIGRARSIWSPRILETLDFIPAHDNPPYPTFDPIGSLMVNVELAPGASGAIRFIIGYARNKKAALDLVGVHLRQGSGGQPSEALAQEGAHLKPRGPASEGLLTEKKKKPMLIGHGEIPSGTPQPYFEYRDNGAKLVVHTPYTPRPFDHAMSNTVHSVMVTNRGLHTSCNGNSQQNRLTPDWPDTVTKEVPTEAIYLYDSSQNEWYSPTYHPLNDQRAKNESEFGIDGTAIFRMTRADLSTELTVFVPPEDPLGVYLLTVKNNSDRPRRMRVAPYFEMVLAFQPERSGPLQVRRNRSQNALFFENPRNTFRSGWAFVSMSLEPVRVETRRGRFFGGAASVSRPYMVEKGEPDPSQLIDNRQVAAFLGEIDIPARGEQTVAIILGQADNLKAAGALTQKYKDVGSARKSLDDTRKWWLGLMGTVAIETNYPEFDQFQNWLKYQAIAERVWARRGFYQTSGAYGFRDQLQDTVNLIWVDPALARRQILLHASQQFLEGDVFHWFFTLTDGRTAFSCRSHASDNPLWLVWGVVEYIRATGDESILNEMASYVVSEFPFAGLPKNKQGWGHLYHRSTKADSVYRHCMKSIDLVLKKRLGAHGLPLMGTGDWNDGLDEIGSEGRGESVWLGFFLYYILKDMVNIIGAKEGPRREGHYLKKMAALRAALEKTWRVDRYLRAIHDNGTEIGVKDSGVWEIDALTAAWAVMADINPERELMVFNTALQVLEKEHAILLGWPALREDTKPYLGRSSKYPEGVRENGMYCHGVQWLIRASRLLAERFEKQGDHAKAGVYRYTAYRLWLKISPLSHATPQNIEIYGGQPNKQPADILTTFDQGRMIWHGYTGAAGWMLRQAMEGVIGASLVRNEVVLPGDIDKPRGELRIKAVRRDVNKSPLKSAWIN